MVCYQIRLSTNLKERKLIFFTDKARQTLNLKKEDVTEITECDALDKLCGKEQHYFFTTGNRCFTILENLQSKFHSSVYIKFNLTLIMVTKRNFSKSREFDDTLCSDDVSNGLFIFSKIFRDPSLLQTLHFLNQFL